MTGIQAGYRAALRAGGVLSVGCRAVRNWRLFQSAVGENPQHSVRARENRRNKVVRSPVTARLLVLEMAKNSDYTS